MQSAYEILSDPQERAWYDTHREAILHDNGDDLSVHYEHDVRITTADDVLRIITQFHGKIDFSNSMTGFYGILGESFKVLAKEEELACEWQGLDPIIYPSFGRADDSYEEIVKPFYSTWNSFATKKTFSWENVYRYSEAPDRRVRRMMERENKRLRGEAVTKFNDAVRSLIAFVKRRDPRFKPSSRTEAERQTALRDAAAAQAARSRARNHMRHDVPDSVPEWMQSTEAQQDSMSDPEEDTTEEHFECIVCAKSFKSENQYLSHEKSKRHARAVQYLRRQMEQEDKDFSLDEARFRSAMQPAADYTEAPNEYDIDEKTKHADGNSPLISGNEDDTNIPNEPKQVEHISNLEAARGFPQLEAPLTSPGESFSSFEENEYASPKDVEDCTIGGSEDITDTSQAEIGILSSKLASASLLSEEIDPNTRPRLGKAKEKRAKKAAQKSPATAGSGRVFSCAACQAGFPSKTQLFHHIKDFGHAQPVSKGRKSGKSKKQKVST